MANKYEFNIEDINSVIITSLKHEDKYTIKCNRKMNEDGTPSTMFVETYSAEEDRTSEDGLIGVICRRCGTWNFCSKENYEVFKQNDFETMCPDCDDEYENVYGEDHLIETIMSFMDEESFFDVMIFINGRLIE